MTIASDRVALLAAFTVVALVLGLVWRRRSGQFRTLTEVDRLTPDDLNTPLGRQATFVLFSTRTCAPCRSTKAALGSLTAPLDGVAVREVDAEQRLDLVRRLHVLRTPTVLLLDPSGRVVRRASGGLTAAQARAALADVLPEGALT